jgi:hypothetical protein
MNFFERLADKQLSRKTLDAFSFSSMLTVSACSKTLFHLVRKIIEDELKNKENIEPSSSILHVHTCESCRCRIRRENSCSSWPLTHASIIYRQDSPPRRIIVVCVEKWRCRFHALVSRGKSSAKRGNIYLLRPLTVPEEIVSIPRSSGGRSNCVPISGLVIKLPKRKDIGPCCEFIWAVHRIEFIKMGQLSHCHVIPRELLPEETLALNKCAETLNLDVISVIREFLSFRKALRPVFHSWKFLHGDLIGGKYKEYIKKHTLHVL